MVDESVIVVERIKLLHSCKGRSKLSVQTRIFIKRVLHDFVTEYHLARKINREIYLLDFFSGHVDLKTTTIQSITHISEMSVIF